MEEATIWKIIGKYFQENPQALVKHHIDSYNEFYGNDIFQLFKEMNPIKLDVDYDKTIQDFRSKCLIYMGGKEGSKIYFGKPVIHDSDKDIRYMYPNECRLRDMTYSTTIHYDVEIEYTRILRPTDQRTELDDDGYAIMNDLELKETDENGQNLKKDYTPSEYAKMRDNTLSNIESNTQFIKMRFQNLYFGRFPIMVQSNLCILNGLPRKMRFSLGECLNDNGGYFIIDGNEKVVIPQESFGDNMINIYKDRDEKYSYSADIKSVSENVSKPVRQLSVRILSQITETEKNNIGVFIPNAGNQPIPLFIVFRALGVLTDKDIISYCMLQDHVPPLFVPYLEASIHDAAPIITQYDAIHYISMFVKGRSVTRTMRILADYFLPHIGENNFIEKAYYLGYIVNRLLSVATGLEPETERDSYKYKRLQLIGPMMKNLFREYYAQQQKYIEKFFEHRYEFGKSTYSDLSKMIYRKYQEAFSNRMVEEGFRKAFKGRWGAYDHTKIVGVVQDMNRLSHNGFISHLRKTNLPMDSSVKLTGPRVLHGSQWGIVDPIDTPDGGNVGLHKHLSIMSKVTNSLSREPMIEWLKKHFSIKLLTQSLPIHLRNLSKLFVNGYWVGCIADPKTMIETTKLYRRQGLIPLTTSISFDIDRNTVFVCCDGGRLCRPIFYCDQNRQFSFQKSEWKTIEKHLESSTDTEIWKKIMTGFHEKKKRDFDIYDEHYYNWEELYAIPKEDNITKLKAIMEYLDTQETESSYIAMNFEEVTTTSTYTHCELHPSTTYGVMCNLINYLEHNPCSRNSFSCGQSKQACSLYSTNYQVRMDKSAVVLNNGQIPIVRSRYLEYINNEENPYGENVMVAIMCYTGYNVEDAILINESALQRGLFRTTYYTTYSAHEEKEIKHDTVINEKTFGKISDYTDVKGVKPDYDYSQLNEHGLINENTVINDKVVLIGQTTLLDGTLNTRKDSSKVPKKGQLGIVDKSFITEGEAGERIAKVRIREERIPTFGDKFASRAGQKGTVGMVIPEANMPFTKNGIRPDIIVNPHALPSRMTLGQMIECIVGKSSLMEGVLGDCTAFYNRENKLGMFGEVLTKHGFHSNGDEIMYDGQTGKQLDASIFFGPTYYMRLKHMVKDKINYRARGPMTNLTRQPVHGRANDGGLRIGEMERDAVISHGLNHFLQESMMDRGDAYRLAICNKTGMIAIYNESKDLMISPAADGPLQYTGSIERDNDIEVRQITKHGRQFSMVHVPYSMKLLMQELQAINVHMRIITDDNVQQFDHMVSSKNIDLLLKQENATPQMIIDQIKSSLENKNETNSLSPYDPTQTIPREMIGLYPELEVQGYTEEEKEIYRLFSDKEKRALNSNYDLQNRKRALQARINEKLGIIDTSKPPSPDEPPPNYLSPEDPVVGDEMNTIPQESQQSITPEDEIQPMSQYGGDGFKDIGTKVHLNGDQKINRIWTIMNVNDNGTYTIDTEDLQYIGVEESRKIVEDKDIRIPNILDQQPLGKIQFHPQFYEEPIILDQPMAESQQPPINNPTQPSVNIKIFNQGGSDQSVNEGTTSNIVPEVPNQDMNTSQSQPLNILYDKETQMPIPISPSIPNETPMDFNNKNWIISKEE